MLSVVALAGAGLAAEQCSCDSVKADLRAEFLSELGALRAELHELLQPAATKQVPVVPVTVGTTGSVSRSTPPPPPPPASAAGGDSSAAGASAAGGDASAAAVSGTDMSGRRLTGSSTYIAVNAQQIHELPNGHTCSNTGFVESNPFLVRLDTSGPSLSVSPTVASADVSFASVDAKDLTVSEIQRMANPFKVVHAADCATAPTLDLPLSTTVGTLAVSGTLTVGGTAVTGGGGALSWTALTLNAGFEGAPHDPAEVRALLLLLLCALWLRTRVRTDRSYAQLLPPASDHVHSCLTHRRSVRGAQYAVNNGFVHLRGLLIRKSTHPSYPYFATYQSLFTTPTDAVPANGSPNYVTLPIATQSDSGNSVGILRITWGAAYLRIPVPGTADFSSGYSGTTDSTHIFLNGLSYLL